jgi:hypothetical protein
LVFIASSPDTCFFRSTFFPRVLGLALAIGGLGYIANITAIAIPPATAAHLFPYIMLPAGIAEILLTLWLIVVGVNVPKWRAQASMVGIATRTKSGDTVITT